MIEINLLPWRLQAYKKQQIRLYGVLGAILFSVIISLMILHIFYHKKIDSEKIKIEALYFQLSQISAESNKAKIIKQQTVVLDRAIELFKKIKMNEIVVLSLFNKMTQLTSSEIKFLEIKSNQGVIFLKGISDSSSILYELVSGFKDPYFPTIQIMEIRNNSILKQLNFQLQITQINASLFERDVFRDAFK